MATVGTFPPDEVSVAAQQWATGARITPGVVGALDGPEAVGPEAAGALTLLHTTFVDDPGAQRGYRHFAEIKADLRVHPGFQRWLTFSDGPHGYALGFWRNADDVTAFVQGTAHRAMVAEQLAQPFEYSQFAGIWIAHAVGHRWIHCEACGKRTAAPAAACRGCGNRLDDPFGAGSAAMRESGSDRR